MSPVAETGLLELLGQLGNRSGRADAARRLARHLGAEALFAFVGDGVLSGTLVPAPGFPPTLPGGAEWRDLLKRACSPGIHQGRVRFPEPGATAPAIAAAQPGLALVFVGGEVEADRLHAIMMLAPLLASLLGAEHQEAVAHAQARMASEAASQASTLAAALERAHSKEKVARAEAETLFRIADTLNAAELDVDALLQHVVDEATAMAGAAFGAFVPPGRGPGEVTFKLRPSSGWSGDAFAALGLPDHAPLVAPTLYGKRVVRLDDMRRDLGSSGSSVASYLAVPVVTSDGSIIGALVLGHPEPSRFEERHERILKALAASAAVAITRKRSETERRRRQAKEHVLSRASALLLESLDGRSTLRELAHLVVPGLADWCVLHVEQEGAPLRIIAHADPAKVAWAEDIDRRWPPHPHDARGSARVMQTGIPELIRDVSDDVLLQLAHDDHHLAELRAAGIRSRLCVPLRARKQIIGALTLATCEGSRRFDDSDLQLAQELADRAALCVHNARLYGEAHEANRAKDEFLAMLGHELRNPLAPIATAAQLLTMKVGELVPKETAIIQRQVNHLKRLVDDLLDVSRITRGKTELKLRPLELAEVVAGSVEACAPLLEQRHHELVIDVPDRGLSIRGDLDRLVQVVSNLITNGAKYTESGGRITLAGSRDADTVVLRVRDTGTGISRELLPRLFDLFVQGRSTIDRAHGGLGLGLTIVQSLVAMHGGTVSAHSDGPGCGSEFVVRLPFAQAASPSADARGVTPSRSDRAAAAMRILIVDDNRDGADALADALKAAGHETHVAYDGPSAIKKAHQAVPDVGLLDLGLPVMDGFELAEHLRRSPPLRALRLVAVTGYGQDSDRAKSRAAGFEAHLVKPITIDQIEACLAGLGAGRRIA